MVCEYIYTEKKEDIILTSILLYETMKVNAKIVYFKTNFTT